ncbi:hypothetical protein [Halovulum marinum]|uniref:hypothetical protein n=1 Tax=Halovulum marinum TaxID=2662447 RepID=UPI001F220BAB|nr:hypothetical protein [Halovulum marinum]
MTEGPRRVTELGITVMPEYVQSDGVQRILSQLTDLARATSVTTSPYVVARAAEGTGHREPPADGGAGRQRLLDRPLFGEPEIWMTTSPSFTPDAGLYESSAYRPPAPDALTEAEGAQVGAFLTAAADRGLDTWLQIQAAIPPCHRVQFGGPAPGDECLRPDGSALRGRVDNNASLAAPGLRAYVRAFVTDLCRAYPQVGGFKFDWPEYPVYHFDALFFDFNPATARFAAGLGLDFEALRRGTLELLTKLSDGSARTARIDVGSFGSFRASLLACCPVLEDLLAFRTAIVEDYAAFLRQTVAEASGGTKRLFLQCFPPPLNLATGFDLTRAGAHADVVGVKFYTMHWPMIEADYLAALTLRADLDPRAVARALSRLLALSPDAPRDPDAIRYPAPDEPHAAADSDLTAKMRAARAQVPQGTQACGITHGYGPLEDVVRRFRAVAAGADGAVHVNRYCYLSDPKLHAIGQLVARPESQPA